MKTSFIAILFFLIYNSECISQSELSLIKIDSLRFEMYKCASENRLADVAKFYADNAIVNGFDAQLNGIMDIKEYWKKLKGKGIDWSWEIHSTIGTDSLILQSGLSHLTLGYGSVNKTYSSFFNVSWKLQANNEWRIVSDEYFHKDQFTFFSYEVIRDSMWIYNGTDSIYAVVFKPKLKNEKRLPAIFCLQGGGNIGKENYFYEAEMFAKAGIVSIVCDKSGAGKSKGKSSWITQTFNEKIDEYSYILQWLSKQTYVDSNQIGVHGPSEGGRLALALAIQHPENVRFVNAVSAPLETLKENQLYAIENLLIKNNYDYSIIAQVLCLFNQYFDAVNDRKIPQVLIDKIQVLKSEFPNLYLPPIATDLPRMPQPEDINFGKDTDYEKIGCPILYQYGKDDVIVNVASSVKRIGHAKNHFLKIYEGTDHSINYPNGDIHGSYHLDKLKWIYSNLKFN